MVPAERRQVEPRSPVSIGFDHPIPSETEQIVMARKQAVDQEVLRYKMPVLERYISYWEEQLDQFRINLDKASIPAYLGNRDLFMDLAVKAVGFLYSAEPSTSLIAADLERVRMELNEEKNAPPNVAALKKRAMAHGFPSDSFEGG